MHNSGFQGSSNSPNILLTGATGYIGGRLLTLLEKNGKRARCLARHPENLRGKAGPSTEIVQGDVLDKKSLSFAMAGIDVAFYMVHSMGSQGDFVEEELISAQNFGEAASECKVGRIIYLGGLGNEAEKLSPHLKSRQQVGEILRQYAKGVKVIEFRASIVIGSGSLSFEMIRCLSERLPFMISPKWVWTLSQPIAIEDVLKYLVQAIDLTVEGNPIYEIGGKDKVSYADIMREYCRQRGLKRLIIPAPVLSPRLSSLWLNLVTPLYYNVGRKLIQSATCTTVVHDSKALQVFPINPLGISEAIARALKNEDLEFAQTAWFDSLSSSTNQPKWAGVHFLGRIIDSRSIVVPVPAAQAFAPIRRIGGKTGWYYANWLWVMRGFIDRMLGGVGMRRGRRDPENLKVGDVLDFWRVEAYEPGQSLVLYAEMKVPGRAWLQFNIRQLDGHSRITQIASFDPVGILGLSYWYLLYPLHQLVFNGMLKGIANAAQNKS